MMKSIKYILVVLFFVTCCVSEILAGGNSGCFARPFVFGSECRSDTAVIGNPSATISYSIRFTGNTLLCCKAYYCVGNSCSLRSIGCSNSGSLRTRSLKWGNIIAKPSVQCKGTPFGTGYSFRH